MPTTVTLIPGDGIGPSIADATVRVLEAAGADLAFDVQVAGQAGVTRYHDPMPDATLDSIRRTRVALKGPLETPVGEGFRSVNVALRKAFDLYANVRPAHVILRGGRFDKVDIVLVRENTEGLYVGIEHYIRIGDDPKAAAESTLVITRHGSERIVRYAFEYALAHGRKKVTLVHKANILAAAMMLDHLGEHDRGDRIRNAFEQQVREGTVLTRDLGGTAGTDAFTDELVARVRG